MHLFLKRQPAVGSRPGTLVTGGQVEPTRVRQLQYSASELAEGPWTGESADEGLILWLDVRGLGDVDRIRELGERFGFHTLTVEDVVNVPQRPKVELFQEGPRGALYFFVFRSVRYEPRLGITARQVSILLGERFVLTFQETAESDLEPVRRRLHEALGPIRSAGADYLAYAFVDAVIDGYYPVLEAIADEIEELEEVVLRNTAPAVLRRLQGQALAHPATPSRLAVAGGARFAPA